MTSIAFTHRLPTAIPLFGATLAVASAGFSGASIAQGAVPGAEDKASPVVVIVKVPKPWYAPRAVVVGKMRETMPQYANLPGLMFKAFSFERSSGDYGGVYYWRDRASAQAWFSTEWFERVKKERGQDAKVSFVVAPLSLDNTPGGTPLNADSTAVVTHVEVATPIGVTPAQLTAEFAKAVPTYQKVPGLLRKHFTVSDKGSFGGVYIWRDETSAKAWFNDAWHQRVIKTYGQDARIEWFDAPVLLPTSLSTNAKPAL